MILFVSAAVHHLLSPPHSQCCDVIRRRPQWRGLPCLLRLLSYQEQTVFIVLSNLLVDILTYFNILLTSYELISTPAPFYSLTIDSEICNIVCEGLECLLMCVCVCVSSTIQTVLEVNTQSLVWRGFLKLMQPGRFLATRPQEHNMTWRGEVRVTVFFYCIS